MSLELPQNPISVVIEGALEPAQLLEVLNEGSGGFVRRYALQQDLLKSLTDQSLFALVSAAVTVTTALRALVSTWIDTGLRPDGEERPLDRTLQAAAALHHAVGEFHRDYPIHTRMENLGDPGQRMICDVGCYSLLRGDRALPAVAEAAAMAWAQSFFVALLLSPWKDHLCRCRRCGKFFMLLRAPRKSGYIRGVHCESCASAASAVAITSRNRRDEGEILLKFAAKQCSVLRCHANPEIIKQRATLIAERATRNLANLKGRFYGEKRIGKKSCSRKWVVTHAAELAREQERYEAERPSHAGRGRSDKKVDE